MHCAAALKERYHLAVILDPLLPMLTKIVCGNHICPFAPTA